MSDDGRPEPDEQPGYWQQQAAGGANQPPSGPQFNPQSAYPVGQTPPPYPPANPYAAQHPYPPAPGHPGMPRFPVYVMPDLPKATAALVVGLVAVGGGFLCAGVPLLASPVAWVLGAQARRQIRQAPHQWGGESKATAGMVLGIIGTVLLVIGLIIVIVIVALALSDPGALDPNTSV